MRTLKGVIALPFAVLLLAWYMLLWPTLLVLITYWAFGDDSPAFSIVLFISLIWAWLNWRRLQKAGRRAAAPRRRKKARR